MNILPRLSVLPLLCALAPLSWAATELYTTNFSQNNARMVITDKHLLTLESNPNQYLIMNIDTGEHLSVFVSDKLAVEMSALPPFNKDSLLTRASLPKRAKFELKPVGKGPEIAGYPTKKYQILADNTVCAETWLSMEAMEKAKLKRFLTQFSKHSTKQREAYLSAGTEYDACDDAMGRAAETYPTHGLAMKTVDKSGSLMQEVTKIALDITFDESTYIVPDDYKRITFDELIRMENAEADRDESLLEQLD